MDFLQGLSVKWGVISVPQAEALAFIILAKNPVADGGHNGVAVSFILLYIYSAGGNLDFAVAGGKGRARRRRGGRNEARSVERQ